VSALKMDEVVCAHNIFKQKGAKPTLQATVLVVTFGVQTKGLPAPASKMDEVVCAHKLFFLWPKGTKPILQATVLMISSTECSRIFDILSNPR
jgi:hypothetical protein